DRELIQVYVSHYFIEKQCVLSSTLFPYTTLFRSYRYFINRNSQKTLHAHIFKLPHFQIIKLISLSLPLRRNNIGITQRNMHCAGDRKSTRLNSSHVKISYAVVC